MERLLVWGVTLVGLVVVGVLGYGLVVEKAIKAREPVAIVGDTSITTAEFQARVRFTRMQMQDELQRWILMQQSLDTTDPTAETYLEYIQGQIRSLQSELSPTSAQDIGVSVLEQLIQEALIRQEAEHRGVAVTPDELQREIELFFGYDRDAVASLPIPTLSVSLTQTEVLTPTPTDVSLSTPTPMTEDAFRQGYDEFLSQVLKPLGISERQFRSWFEVSVLTEKVREQMMAEVPATADQVQVRRLMVDDEERANELAARLDAGEDFQTLVDELAEDEEVTGYGGELGWYPEEALEQTLGVELADLAFSLEVGEHSQPVLSEEGAWYIIIEVMGREVREVDEWIRQQWAEEAFQAWLETQQVWVERKEYDLEIVPTEP